MNPNQFTLGEKIIMAGCGVSVISLFMTWVDLGILKANGFQQQGYLFFALWLYPVIMTFMQKKSIKALNIGLSVAGIVGAFAFAQSKSTDFLGVSINAAGAGIYVMMISFIVVLVGCLMNKRA